MFERDSGVLMDSELICLRREFHRYPETGGLEYRTTARIIDELEKLGLPVQYGSSVHTDEKLFIRASEEESEFCINRAREEGARPDLLDAMRGGYTGCVAVIEGAKPGPTIGIRVDIDALTIQETSEPSHAPAAEDFVSVHENCMHACGHDAHAAIGVGVAKLLCANRDSLCGKVILIFQPGEELLLGAGSMTAAGVVSQCDYLFGVHVGLQSLPVGTVAASVTGFLAIHRFDAIFRGEASHAGGAPEKGRNALAAAATATVNMLAIPRHHEGSSRINVGEFIAGTGRNVIPDKAFLSIETRGASTAINKYMADRAECICRAAADMYECQIETVFMGSCNSAACDTELVAETVRILSHVDGVERVITDFDFGASEDIVTMFDEVQARGGQATELIIGMPLVAPHHNDHFDIDERVIGIGARCLAQLALGIGAKGSLNY